MDPESAGRAGLAAGRVGWTGKWGGQGRPRLGQCSGSVGNSTQLDTGRQQGVRIWREACVYVRRMCPKHVNLLMDSMWKDFEPRRVFQVG